MDLLVGWTADSMGNLKDTGNSRNGGPETTPSDLVRLVTILGAVYVLWSGMVSVFFTESRLSFEHKLFNTMSTSGLIYIC